MTTSDTIRVPRRQRRHDAPPRRPASRAGAVAALVKAATYLVGLGLLGAYLAPRGFVAAQRDPAASLAFLIEHQTLLYAWYLVLYLVGGAALVVLVLALHERVRHAADPLLARSATGFGLTWAGLLLASGLVALVGQRAVIALAADDPATATATWSSVSVVQEALGGGIEVVGAVWVLLIGVAGLRSGALGRGVSGLGIALGVCGALTVLPAAADAMAAVFGVGLVAWFGWIAATLLRRRS